MWILTTFQISPEIQLVNSLLGSVLWLLLAALLSIVIFVIAWDVMASKSATRKAKRTSSRYFPNIPLTNSEQENATDFLLTLGLGK